MRLSDRANTICGSATVELNARVLALKKSGVNIIKFNIGEPDFNTPENICNAGKRAMDEGNTRYTAVPGMAELREQIVKKLKEDNDLFYSAGEICVTTGAKQALFETMMALVQEGDEVIIPTPCWVSYENMVKIAGATPVFVPTKQQEDDLFNLDISAIKAAITANTRAIIINTPNNPTGVVYPKSVLLKLLDLAIEHDFTIVADEIYEKLIYNGKTHFSIASISEEAKSRVVTINGFSKSYAMTGWRLGYLAGPENLVKAVQRLQGHITSASSSISQIAGIEALAGSQASIEKMKGAFNTNRLAMFKLCGEISHLSCREPDGAFYLMPDVSWYYGKSADGVTVHNSTDLANYLLEKAHVAVVPGDGFHSPNCIRLSYSNSLKNIRQGMEQMKQAFAQLK